MEQARPAAAEQDDDQTLLDPLLLQQRVGAVALAAAAVETSLLLLAATMINSDAGAVLARGQTTSTLIDWCTRLSLPPLTPEPMERPIRAHLKQAEVLLERRHDVVHGRWLHLEPHGAFTIRLKRRTSVEQGWTAQTMDHLRRDLVSVARDLDLDRDNLCRVRRGEPMLGPPAGGVDS